MNGSQWDQSRFTVGGGGSKAYDEGFERTFGDRKAASDADGLTSNGGRAAKPSEAALLSARAANDAILLRAAVLALLKTSDETGCLIAQLEALASEWEEGWTGEPPDCARALRAILRGEK